MSAKLNTGREFKITCPVEGYDWRTLKKKFRKDEKRDWSTSEEVRQHILTYGREGHVPVEGTVLEFEGAERTASEA